jgi:long-subunit fatty acid transport protein
MKTLFLRLVVLMLWVGCLHAFGQSNAGSSSAQFLKIGVGARAIGMGDAFAAVSDDALALYWNPAGMALLKRVSLTTTHSEWFAGLSHDFIGVVVPLGENALGASATFLNSDEVEITTIQQPEGTGIYYDATDMAISLSYARSLLEVLSVGISAKFIYQKLYNESANTFAIDVGTLLDTGFKGLRIGMCLSNFGGEMKLDGTDLIVPYNAGGNIAITPDVEAGLSTQSWPLPMNFRIGIAIDIVGSEGKSIFSSESNRLTLAIDGNHPTDNVERGSIGMEYAWQSLVALRAGYKYNYDEEGMTLGGGVKVTIETVDLLFDYAWADFGRLGPVHRFTLGCVL